MSTTQPEVIARLLRASADAQPLWVAVEGSSMGRTIVPPGQVLVVPGDAPKRRQIWAFCDPGGVVVVHRYKGRRGQDHIFQGDAVAWEDPPVPAERLIGRVTALRRGERVGALGPRSTLVGLGQRWYWVGRRRARNLVRRIRRRVGGKGGEPNPAVDHEE